MASVAVPCATIRDLDAWEACKLAARERHEVLLLQMGSPACTKCPAFSTTITKLKLAHRFTHVYVNTHDAEEDLLDDLQVTQLPAYRLVTEGEDLQEQAVAPDKLSSVVARHCPPVLRLDDEF